MGTAPMPLLSLIVPVYNGAPYVAENIREIVRVLETLGATFEVLVVCDGSTDATAGEVGHREGSRGRALGYSLNPAKGNAISFAVPYARGRLVGWLDGDLDIEPQAIVDAVRRFEHSEVD